MMIKENYTKNRHISQFICLIWLTIFSGCAEPTLVELPLSSQYGQIAGSEYRIIAAVEAYGIYENLDKKVISYITLIPGVGISGPEVAFKKRIDKGQKIVVLSAWQERKLLHSNVYYVIALQDTNIPRDIQVRIDLSRGNEGVGAELNQRVYEKIKGKQVSQFAN
jgi:hypothetical protein